MRSRVVYACMIGVFLVTMASIFSWGSGMKTVTSAGKQVSFRVPKNWQSEPEGNGMMFYAPEPDSGTLRLDVLTFRSPNSPADEPPSSLSHAQKMGVPLETLPSGIHFLRAQTKAKEEDDDLASIEWNLEAREGEYTAIAIFSFTLLESQVEVSKYKEQIEMLDREIRQATVLP